MNPFVFSTTSQIVFRPGASAEIGGLLGPKFGERILFVTDGGLRKLGLCDPALASLSGSGIAVTVFDAVEADPSLTTVEAAVELAKAAGVTGVIGFGGGSSDAATVLVALNALWGVGYDTGRLATLALRLGADVPVFVRGENAWAEGVGERLSPLALPAAWYVLADPGVHAPTAALFRAPELTRDAPPATIADFVSGAPLGNVFEPVLRAREPAVEAVFAALSQIGSPRLTGSGSGCFVEFATREDAGAALAALPPGLRAWVAPGAARSPLLAALEAFRPDR